MSENICYTDGYARETEAVVVEVDPEANAVLLPLHHLSWAMVRSRADPQRPGDRLKFRQR